jgi:hypothetical protein
LRRIVVVTNLVNEHVIFEPGLSDPEFSDSRMIGIHGSGGAGVFERPQGSKYDSFILQSSAPPKVDQQAKFQAG